MCTVDNEDGLSGSGDGSKNEFGRWVSGLHVSVGVEKHRDTRHTYMRTQSHTRSHTKSHAITRSHVQSHCTRSVCRLTLLREVNYDVKLNDLVSNPAPELINLRTGVLSRDICLVM